MHMTKRKKSIWKATNSVIPSIWHSDQVNYGHNKNISSCQGLGRRKGEMSKQSTGDIWDTENALFDTTVVATIHSTLFKPIECTPPRVDPMQTMDSGWWCWVRLNKCIKSGGGCWKWERLYMWRQRVYGNTLLSAQLCYEPKMALKNNILKNWQDDKFYVYFTTIKIFF